MNTNYNRLFLLFHSWLKTQEYSYNTKLTYLQICKKFLSYLDGFGIPRIKRVDRGLLLNFITRKADKLYAQNYINMRQSALSVFYAWAHSNKYCQNNPMLDYRKAKISTKPYPQKVIKNLEEISMLTPKEQQTLLSTAGDDFTATRNRCIIYIILATALYAEEAIGLLINEIDLEQGYVDISKKNKKRRVPINLRACKSACRKWLEVRANTLCNRKSNLLFFTNEIRPITKHTLHRIVSKAMTEARIDKEHLGPEVLRQTAIANMLGSGKTIEEVQAITGIKTLKNIQKYNPVF